MIRHAKTYGNTLGRYIGTTDEGLCPEGREALETAGYPQPEAVYASPMRRCLETAALLWPGMPVQTFESLKIKITWSFSVILIIRPGWTARDRCRFQEGKAGRTFRTDAGRASWRCWRQSGKRAFKGWPLWFMEGPL